MKLCFILSFKIKSHPNKRMFGSTFFKSLPSLQHLPRYEATKTHPAAPRHGEGIQNTPLLCAGMQRSLFPVLLLIGKTLNRVFQQHNGKHSSGRTAQMLDGTLALMEEGWRVHPGDSQCGRNDWKRRLHYLTLYENNRGKTRCYVRVFRRKKTVNKNQRKAALLPLLTPVFYCSTASPPHLRSAPQISKWMNNYRYKHLQAIYSFFFPSCDIISNISASWKSRLNSVSSQLATSEPEGRWGGSRGHWYSNLLLPLCSPFFSSSNI